MRSRRVRFAAPFVIVTTASCGQPAPVQLPTESPVVATSSVDGATIDPITPLDAAPVRAYIWVTIAMPEHTVQPKGYISCHNFGPQYRGCNPPRPSHYPAFEVTTPILEMNEDGDGSIVVIAQKHDKDAGDGLIKRGAVVTAQAMSMKERAPVGHVVDTTPTTATLALDLPIDDVKNGADLLIQGTWVVTSPSEEPARPHDPLVGQIIAVDVSGSYTIITVALGSDDGVDRSWRLEVIDKKNRPAPNGAGTVVKVTKQTTYAKVKLTRDQVEHYQRVRLSPPAP
jgi:hypothetical protein